MALKPEETSEIQNRVSMAQQKVLMSPENGLKKKVN